MSEVYLDQALIIAQQLEAGGRLDDALDIYTKLLPAAPSHFGLTMKVGQLSEKCDSNEQALEAFRSAVKIKPDSFMAVSMLSSVLWKSRPEDAIETLSNFAKQAPVPEKAEALSQLARLREWDARQNLGLPIHHLLDFDEFTFNYALDTVREFGHAAENWVSIDPTNLNAHLFAGFAKQAVKDCDAANSAYKAIGNIDPKSYLSRLQLGQPGQPSTELPPVEGKWPSTPCVFLACDRKYLKLFATPFLRSLARFTPGQRVHLHVMSEVEDKKSLLDDLSTLDLSFSFERGDEYIARHKLEPRSYYGAARLIRFAQALEKCDGPLWMLDVDSLAHSDPSSLLSMEGDVGVRVRAGRIEPWNQFSACLIMGRPEGRAYFREVSKIISQNLPSAWWGLDQYALFSAYILLQTQSNLPSFTLMGPKQADVEWRDDGIFWFTAGSRKNRLIGTSPPPNPSKYEKLFAGFKNES